MKIFEIKNGSKLNFLISQNRSFPSLEYVLQGSIQDDSVHLLKARLQGLCDNITGSILHFN